MKITFAPKGILQIDDARIMFRNFSGAPSKFNSEGDRNFAVVFPNSVLNDVVFLGFPEGLSDKERGEVSSMSDEELLKNGYADTVGGLLAKRGWNIRTKPPREDGEEPLNFLPVKVKFNDRGPTIYLRTNGVTNQLDKESVGMLDNIDILSVDMDIRPYHWEVKGETGVSAYLQSMCVTQRVDRFAERFVNEQSREPVPNDPY